MWIIFKFRINLAILLALLFLASFLYNIFYIELVPSIIFYSPLSRAWELLSGCGLAYWISIQKNNQLSQKNIKIGNILSIVGIGLIIFGTLNITADVFFPGAWALFPIFGTLLIILAGSNSWLNRYYLSNPLLVFIGLISYPLYLWHWPLLSFMRILSGGEPSNVIRFLIIMVSIFLAWLTYEFIEKPIRFGYKFKYKIHLLILLMCVVGIFGFEVYKNNGFEDRHGGQFKNSIYLDEFYWDSYKSSNCALLIGVDANFCIIYGNPENIKLAIIGDSTGNSLAPGIAEAYNTGIDTGIINIGSWTCPPIEEIDAAAMWGKKNNCMETITKGYDYILRTSSIKVVVLAIFARDLKLWQIRGETGLDEQSKFNIVVNKIDIIIKKLHEAGKIVVVSYDAPFLPFPAKSCMKRPFDFGRKNCYIKEDELVDRYPYLNYFDEFFKKKNVCIFRQSDVLIKNGALNLQNEYNQFLIRDTHHLTKIGSQLIGDKFMHQDCLNLNEEKNLR